MRVALDPVLVARALARGGRYLTPARASQLLGVSPRAAGRVLAWLERQGLARRVSRRAYEILPPQDHSAGAAE